MKAPRITVGHGTLARYKRGRAIITLSLRDNGYGPGTCFSGEPVKNWSCMTAREARQLAMRLERAAARAEGQGQR